MTLIAVSKNNIVVSKGIYVDCYDYSKHHVLKITSGTPGEDEKITDIVLSFDGKLLAVLLSKIIIIYDLPHLKNIKKFVLPRSASKIRFGVNNSSIFVADKTGDVLHFELNEDSGTKLLGHLSLLLNVLQTNDGKYIITSDRDEKIRVSCYPNTYNIQTYCLGHKEFVNHIELVQNTDSHLTSTSGDGTVKFWNYINGSLLYTIDTYMDIKNNDGIKEEFCKIMDEEGIEINSLPIVDYTITKLNDVSSLIAVAIHSYMKILVYQVSFINGQFSHSLVKDIPVNNFPTAIKFYNLTLFVYDGIDSVINEYKVETNNDNISLNPTDTIKVFENMEVQLSAHDHSSIKLLFKRKFDNVQEYQDRKKQRLEKPIE
ncbi:tRNA (guanine-N(7)-)-methyltransferase non-catalytic subunit wuho [Maniola hyperantus]|uniref:tRNA (guanine-N(7)-)-methyltransferase non-catalytic subunit wuho n=1 Tax=Aphantopus hyperantus TaxID=2795564 RepID=UPI001568FCB2|nr:tRNA (guanine-N(7)-)-methyltransferase non-catalytic subunit wuho [Maniola hyperantus]